MIKREPIENTPFWRVTTEKGSFLTFGEYRVSEIYTTEEEATQALEVHKWEIIMRLAAVIVEKSLQMPQVLEVKAE